MRKWSPNGSTPPSPEPTTLLRTSCTLAPNTMPAAPRPTRPRKTRRPTATRCWVPWRLVPESLSGIRPDYGRRGTRAASPPSLTSRLPLALSEMTIQQSLPGRSTVFREMVRLGTTIRWRTFIGPCVENGANDVGTSGHRSRALCSGDGMDTPRNESHSRDGDEWRGQVGGHWGGGRRGGFRRVLPGPYGITEKARPSQAEGPTIRRHDSWSPLWHQRHRTQAAQSIEGHELLISTRTPMPDL